MEYNVVDATRFCTMPHRRALLAAFPFSPVRRAGCRSVAALARTFRSAGEGWRRLAEFGEIEQPKDRGGRVGVTFVYAGERRKTV